MIVGINLGSHSLSLSKFRCKITFELPRVWSFLSALCPFGNCGLSCPILRRPRPYISSQTTFKSRNLEDILINRASLIKKAVRNKSLFNNTVQITVISKSWHFRRKTIMKCWNRLRKNVILPAGSFPPQSCLTGANKEI